MNSPTPQPPGDTPTPRTDAFMQGEHVAFDGLWIDFARQLECKRTAAAVREAELVRQLSEANERVDQALGENANEVHALRQRLAEVEKQRDEAKANATIWFQRLLQLGCTVDYEGWRNTKADIITAQFTIERAARLRAEEALEAIWSNCRIVYYPPSPAYPFEHALHAGKDMRRQIEQALTPPVAPAPL